MKKLIYGMMLVFGLASCAGKQAEQTPEVTEAPHPDGVELIYFHGKIRCASCQAIEENAREAIDSLFAAQLQSGDVVFRTVDISTPEGESLADSYEVSSSSFFVNRWKDGKEMRNNLTEFGFATARYKSKEFKDSVISLVRKNLD